MLELAEVLARFGPSYRLRYGARMLPSHHRAMDAIVACRTAALGGQVVACDDCPTVEYVYHSCRHRACPKCGRPRTDVWLEARQEELLPARYFHVTFTIPAALRRVVRRRQRALLGALMRAAGETLVELAADPRFLGGQVGVLAVLHTWSRTLEFHPHVHCLVPGGALTRDGTWRPARKPWLVPGPALAEMFRGRFVALARRAVPGLVVPSKVFRQRWVVHADAVLQGTPTVLRYLGRYVHRVALTNARLVAIDGDAVVFRYKERKQPRWRTMRLEGHEFLRRFLQHVLPRGFHKVRYYGLWSPGRKAALLALRHRLAPASETLATPTPEVAGDVAEEAPPPWRRCRACGGVLRVVEVIPRPPRAEPRGPP